MGIEKRMDLTATEFQRLRRRLLSWYDANHRALPWRETSDPYRIWVSEIMLQQTQVASVIDYYRRFLDQFPSIQALAEAQLDDVLKLWSGLGYYRRARSMHSAAQQIVEQHGGKFPRSLEEIQLLSGVGRYTAGAIASFAYDQPAPILEANTVRLYARLLGIDQPVQTSAVQSQLWEFATTILPSRSGSGRVNQAVMELGSLICTPQSPNCAECPLQPNCRAYQLGLESKIPVQVSKPKPVPMMHVGVIIWDSKQRILLLQNQAGQWWEGLWDLPWVEMPYRKKLVANEPTCRELESAFGQLLNLRCEVKGLHRSVRHAVTKFTIDYHCMTGALEPRARLPKQQTLDWFSLEQLPPMSSRFHKIKLE